MAAHPTAAQVGSTEQHLPENSGLSSQRAGDGEDGTWTDSLPNPGAANLCFAAGTRISAPVGEIEIETLTPGQQVLTADGRAVPVRLVGRQSFDPRAWDVPERLEPVCIRAGALGHDLPRRDLVVTSDHAMLLDGMLINASALMNRNGIDFVPHAELPDCFTVYHVEFETHEVILAEGAASESFVDVVTRAHWDNFADYLLQYGAERLIPEMDLPRISSQRLLPPPVRQGLGLPCVQTG